MDVNSNYATVVTRYGGHRHAARIDLFTRLTGRLFTECMGTSSWTIESWESTPDDHPLGLTPDEMRRLPECDNCRAIVGPTL